MLTWGAIGHNGKPVTELPPAPFALVSGSAWVLGKVTLFELLDVSFDQRSEERLPDIFYEWDGCAFSLLLAYPG